MRHIDRTKSLPSLDSFFRIEMVFSKLKTLLRKRAASNFDAITHALDQICGLFSLTECRN
ncbi:hypothetical protein ASE23_21495 [Rhizobium sp. Root73]|nr:hypothetical protein ASD36_27560 [Rhizobium sp. Root1334]KRC12540.1 hypothetical protein ASE23_21495 [Rhizobium sp. Root73]